MLSGLVKFPEVSIIQKYWCCCGHFCFFLSYVEFVVFSQINFDSMSSCYMLHVTTWIYLYFSFYLNNSSNILYRCFLLIINPSNLFLSLKVVVSMEVRITKLKIKKNDDKCWHGCKNGNMQFKKNLKITPNFWYFVILNYTGKESLENSFGVLRLLKNCHLMAGSLHNHLPSFGR